LAGGKAGRGSENKVPFVAAISFNSEGRPLYIKMACHVQNRMIVSLNKARIMPGVFRITPLESIAANGLYRIIIRVVS